MNYYLLAILVIASYFMGNISFGRIISATRHVDITKQGSGNPGMTNVMRTHGAKLGVIVLLLDALKGAIPALAGVLLFGGYVDSNHLFYVTGTAESYTALFACGLASMLGHIFPVIYKFKGGKGVATFVGVFFVAQPILSVIIFILAFLSVLIFKLMSVTSIGIVVLQMTLQYIYMPSGNNLPVYIMIGIMAFLVIFAHRSNIVRLIKGTENITSIQDAIKKDKMRVKQEHKELKQEIKQEHKEIRQEHKEIIKQDKQEHKEAKQNIKNERKETRQEHKQVLKQDKKDYKDKKVEIKQVRKSKLEELKDKKKQLKKNAKLEANAENKSNKLDEIKSKKKTAEKKVADNVEATRNIKDFNFNLCISCGAVIPSFNPNYERSRSLVEIGLNDNDFMANANIKGEKFNITLEKAKQIKQIVKENIDTLKKVSYIQTGSYKNENALEGVYGKFETNLDGENFIIDTVTFSPNHAEYEKLIGNIESKIFEIIKSN